MGIRCRLLPCVAAFAVLLCVPAAAGASVIIYGSDLKSPADMIEAHGADSAFWNISLGSGGATAAPSGGQVVSVRVKGNVLNDPTGRQKPITMFHFQTLRPLPDGSMAVWLSSAPFYTPLGGDSQTISSYQPVNMCVHKGDYLDFNDIGGNEWHWGPFSGTPYQVFSRVPNSTVNFYSKNNGTNIGSRWKPQQTKQAEELLMQMRLATGPNATDICPGGYAQHIYRGVDLRRGQVATLRTRTKTAKIRFTCPGPTYGSCKGTIRAIAVLNGHVVTLGQGSFRTGPAYSDSVELPLSGPHVRAIQRARGIVVRLVATSHDDPSADRRARSNGVPVQSKTNAATIKIRPDRLIQKKKASRKKRRSSRP